MGGFLGGTNIYSTYSKSSFYPTMLAGSQGGLLGGDLGNGLGTCLRGGLGSGSNSLYLWGIRCAQNSHNKLDGLIIRKLGNLFFSTNFFITWSPLVFLQKN